MREIQVSVIIVNYNTLKQTCECIDSICEKTKDISYEIILIDNASTDGSKDFFEKDERVRYVYSCENMGFGRANNVGMMLAKGEYLFLLNSDTLLVNNAIKEFYDYASNHTKNTFYGCWLKNLEGDEVHSCCRYLSPWSLLNDILNTYKKHLGLPYSKSITGNINYSEHHIDGDYSLIGADMFFHRNIYEISGGFDHNYFMYIEETDWQRRMRDCGINAECINTPKIIHLVGGSAGNKDSWNRFRFLNSNRSQNIYVKKFYSRGTYYLFRILKKVLFIPMIFFNNKAKSLSDRLDMAKSIIKA